MMITCLLYLPRRLSSNSAKPCSSRKAAAVMGLSCSDNVKREVQLRKISEGTEASLQTSSTHSGQASLLQLRK